MGGVHHPAGVGWVGYRTLLGRVGWVQDPAGEPGETVCVGCVVGGGWGTSPCWGSVGGVQDPAGELRETVHVGCVVGGVQDPVGVVWVGYRTLLG